MTIIRGATTIACDCKEEISAAVEEMLAEIFTANELKKDGIRSKNIRFGAFASSLPFRFP